VLQRISGGWPKATKETDKDETAEGRALQIEVSVGKSSVTKPSGLKERG